MAVGNTNANNIQTICRFNRETQRVHLRHLSFVSEPPVTYDDLLPLRGRAGRGPSLLKFGRGERDERQRASTPGLPECLDLCCEE